MIGDRERRPLDDIGAIWMGHGVELARRIEAFITDIRGLDLTADQIADQLEELLTTDYNPLTGLPPLGDPPPVVRPAAPDLVRLRDMPRIATPRRSREPGA